MIFKWVIGGLFGGVLHLNTTDTLVMRMRPLTFDKWTQAHSVCGGRRKSYKCASTCTWKRREGVLRERKSVVGEQEYNVVPYQYRAVYHGNSREIHWTYLSFFLTGMTPMATGLSPKKTLLNSPPSSTGRTLYRQEASRYVFMLICFSTSCRS